MQVLFMNISIKLSGVSLFPYYFFIIIIDLQAMKNILITLFS